MENRTAIAALAAGAIGNPSSPLSFHVTRLHHAGLASSRQAGRFLV